jgi:hypothetical protein
MTGLPPNNHFLFVCFDANWAIISVLSIRKAIAMNFALTVLPLIVILFKTLPAC